MNASNMQKKVTYKEKVISRAKRFNRKHKRLSFVGLFYAITAIFTYNILFYFYRNNKRFTCLACILLFFVSSSSFSYPSTSLNISFDSEMSIEGASGESSVSLSGTEVAESDAELAQASDVDSKVLEEAQESVNPDVSEAEAADPDKQASLNDILANAEEVDLSGENQSYNNENEELTFSRDDWKLILVNKQHPIPDDYEFHLGTISGSMRCDERIIQPLLDMMKAASADGVSLIICSPYRDIDRQTMLFETKVDKYMNAGMSYMDAYNLASQAVTVPGSSEHQIGLAIDIICDGYSSLDEGFADTKAGKWLAENSYKYGFILRYPAGKEDITSIEYEPWHFRYVGVDAATVMVDNNLCLEEFWSRYVD
ncbi:M15 family metallopeptidase [Butyrivibrio proteoclasticus]|uniref:M15 family metallopeptidase n=1 Tax=Butyrivibrio proteoclasticus TaxID=43305 RepID=UPI0006885C4F|nr:M15 family metallopeptidase [Butyrivibrio proteoclasticus]